MTLSDTIESCCQDHGLSSRVASDIAERVTDRLAEEAEQGCTISAALLKPIDREALRAELLKAGRVLTDDSRPGWTYAHRVGALSVLLPRIAWLAGMPEVAAEMNAMEMARHERTVSGHRERTAALAPLAVDWAGCTPEPPLERDRRTSEVPA